jgi:hypothetical protein
MAVKVDYAYWAIRFVDACEQGERDRVISSQCNYPWKRLPLLRKALLFGIRIRLSHEDAVVPFLNLLDGVRIIVSLNDGRVSLRIRVRRPSELLTT